MTNIKISKEQLEEIYLTKNYTRNKTAEYFGVKPRYIKILVSKYGLNKTKEQCNANNKGGHTTGLFWFNNGIIETCAKSCPKGFFPGKLSKGFIWWNNGVKTIQAKDCPGKGWIKGRLFSKEELKKRAVAASLRFKGKHLSKVHRQKIVDHWKTHASPLKGGHLLEETKQKISKALTGREQYSTKREALRKLTDEQLLNYLKEDKTIDFYAIYKDLDFPITQNSWEHIKAIYKERGIEHRLYTSASLFEKEVLEYIKAIYKGQIQENVKTLLDRQEVDIYLPEIKLCIECNGTYWHRTAYRKENNKFVISGNKGKDYHVKKARALYEKGLDVIFIWETDWKYRRDEMKQYIKETIDKSVMLDLTTDTILLDFVHSKVNYCLNHGFKFASYSDANANYITRNKDKRVDIPFTDINSNLEKVVSNEWRCCYDAGKIILRRH